MRDPLGVWAAARAGDEVRVSADEVRRGDGCLVVTGVGDDGLRAVPALSWLLPVRPPGPVHGPLERAYAAVRRACRLLAAREDPATAADLLALANVVLSRRDVRLAAECRAAAVRLRGPSAEPLLLAEVQGWYGRSAPSLLDRTVERLFRRLPPYRPVPRPATTVSAIGRTTGIPAGAVDASIQFVYAVVKRTHRRSDPVWTRLARRYAGWPLADAAAHALTLLTTGYADRPRVHRALLGPPAEASPARVIQALLCWSVAPPMPGLPGLPERVAALELGGQMTAYAREFLDGQRAPAALGVAEPAILDTAETATPDVRAPAALGATPGVLDATAATAPGVAAPDALRVETR